VILPCSGWASIQTRTESAWRRAAALHLTAVFRFIPFYRASVEALFSACGAARVGDVGALIGAGKTFAKIVDR